MVLISFCSSLGSNSKPDNCNVDDFVTVVIDTLYNLHNVTNSKAVVFAFPFSISLM